MSESPRWLKAAAGGLEEGACPGAGVRSISLRPAFPGQDLSEPEQSQPFSTLFSK